MQPQPNTDLVSRGSLRLSADIGQNFSLSVGSADVSCTTHLTLSSEREMAAHLTSTSDIREDGSSLNASSAPSSDSADMPECASTQCNTPVEVAGGLRTAAPSPPRLTRVLSSLPLCAVTASPLYRQSAEDETLRAAIAANAKQLLHAVTGVEADEIIDLLYVKETWFSTEVLVYALCLANRLTLRYPHWVLVSHDTDYDNSSVCDSPMRHHSSAGSSATAGAHPLHGNHLLPHVCSSTSSDASHLDSLEEASWASDPYAEFTGRGLARTQSASTNSLGDVFNRHNMRRRLVALLLLSGKFHGDVVYKTASLADVLNRHRNDPQPHRVTPSGRSTTEDSTDPSGAPARALPRMMPARLGQCEKQLFQELGCTVFVQDAEYRCCEDMVLRGL